jgi:vancomycin permeability regulator SanA
MLPFLIGIALALILLPRLLTEVYSLPRVHAPALAPSEPVAIVFGAGLQRDGSPSPVLKDRVSAAASLYQQGKVESILMSGGTDNAYYNEPRAMKAYALEMGVPEQAILMDEQGSSTLASCQRARDVFGIRSALLVTQGFHLPRAIALCSLLGMQVQGVRADMHDYAVRSKLFWSLREFPATLADFYELLVYRRG